MLKKLLLAIALAIVPAAALAATVSVSTGFGPRVGFSTGPDQFVFGGQVAVGEIADNLTFDPNLDIGLGDHQTVVGISVDLHYHFDTQTTWRPYAGGGATLNFVSYDSDHYGDKSSDTFAGGSLIIGAGAPTKSGNRFFTELKLGLGDTADLKLLVGWNFKR